MTKPSKFAAWQEANQCRREALIDEFLKYLDETRVKVRHATDLADLIARHISQVEGAPCNKSTLMRNVRYKAKILTYQAQHLDVESKLRARRSLVDPSANAMLTTKKLEVGNLKREVERLNAYIGGLEEQVEQLKSRRGGLIPAPKGEGWQDSSQPPLSDHEFNFVRTCQALRSVLSHMNLVLDVDTGAKRILDRSRRRNNVVVDKELAGPFIDWLESVSGGQK
ncbi:hypothetical protein AB4Y45_26360 [Paraburkholderia sp. EG287A]|uniref:hypothetical protein n=1 Tax=Paraburkholderia sp. EG287A TaxID=3237012 RepID=UPI0034D28A2E